MHICQGWKRSEKEGHCQTSKKVLGSTRKVCFLEAILGINLTFLVVSPESVGGGVRGAMPLEYLEEDYEAGVDALPQQLRST